VAFEPPYTAPFIAEGAEVDVRSHVGRWVVVSAAAVIGPEARVDDSVLHHGAVVEAGASVTGSVLGARSRVGAGAVVVDSVLAEGATVPAGSKVEGARISAGQTAGSGSGSA
jgi:mannose-1-phosphate guanylyltransferase